MRTRACASFIFLSKNKRGEKLSKPLEVKNYRDQAIKSAKQLMYGENVINKVKASQSIREITRIMKTARESEDKRC